MPVVKSQKKTGDQGSWKGDVASRRWRSVDSAAVMIFAQMQQRCGRKASLFLLVGVLLLGSTAGSAGDGEEEVSASNVLILTDKSLDEKVGKASHLLLEFYAPWCGRCQEVAPAFEEAASELKQVP